MKLRFIFNPRSGTPRRNAPILPMLREFVSSAWPDADLLCTEGPGHATEIARDAVAKGYQRVVAVGGDGTANEVAQALIHTPVAMGLVPCGSGNGLALHLGLPASPRDALGLAAGASVRIAELDTGTVNGFTFVNAMGLGLDAEVGRRFNLLRRRGLPAYARTALAAFLARKTERLVISVGDQNETVEALFIAVANSDQYGNDAKIAPGARIDDGMLDLVIVRPVGLFAACVLGARLFLGSIDRSRDVRHIRGERFVIGRPAVGIIHTDGEIHETGPNVVVQVLPRSLRFMVPDGCAAVSVADERATAGFALRLP